MAMGGGYLVQIYEDAAGESSAEPAAAPNGSDPTPPDDVGEDGEDDEDQDFDDVSGFGCGLQRDFA